MDNAKSVYQRLIVQHQAILAQLQRKDARLKWLRLILFLVTLVATLKLLAVSASAGFGVLVIGIAIFLYLVHIDADNKRSIANFHRLIAINTEELRILDHDFHHRFDGAGFQPHDHDYAHDLDLFGHASLFQWLNRCHTEQGRLLLAKELLGTANISDGELRHDAIRELAAAVEWRQELEALSQVSPVTLFTENQTSDWLANEQGRLDAPAWRVVIPVYTLIAITSIIAAIAGWISPAQFIGLYLLYFIFSTVQSSRTIATYKHLSGIVKEVGTIYELVVWIEEKQFQSELLTRMQQSLKSKGRKAGHELRELKNILDRFDMRLNMAGPMFLNPFLLWDARQMQALNRWKRNNTGQVKNWFTVIAEMEMLQSYAAVHFNFPRWCFPARTETHFTLEATNLGHPLVPEVSRVNNSFTLEGTGKIALVTGSNMAGKSTFLRTLGINILMARIGAPVCAEAFTYSPVRLMSSMRVADNLAESTSTFYAELKKLKTIIDTVNHNEKVFILLDEILRGTNSIDRHKGSEALISQLIRKNAVAVIATHDIELAKLKEQFPDAIENYHFDVQVRGEELEFDYRLKEGICQSLNATILMKKIGIEF